MARKPRVYYAGAIYHVIARGNNRENIFLDCCDKEKYLELVARYKKRYNCEILAYVLMDNHLHILIRIDQTPLSKVMPYQASEPATPGAATRTMQPEIACW